MRISVSDAEPWKGLLPILQTVLDAVVIMHQDGSIIAWNGVAAETFGWSEAEAVGRPLADLIIPDQHRGAHFAGLNRYQQTGEARVLNRRIEITALRKDRTEFPVELSITIASAGAGEVFVGYLRDISERRHAERALRDSETYVRLLLDSTAEGFYAVDRDGTTTLCNLSFLRMLGFEKETDAVGRKLHDIIHHSHADGSNYPTADCPIYRCAQTGTAAHVMDEYFYRLDGSALPVEYWVHPILLDGQLQGAICTFLDVTERLEAQAGAERARSDAFAAAQQQAAILAQLAEGVIVADAEGRLTFVNEAAARIHGAAKLDVPPDEYSSTYHLFTEEGGPYPPADLPLARAVRGETVEDARWRVRRPDGTSVLAVGSARPVLDTRGAQVGAVLTVRDDTHRDAAEGQVRENEARLRALTDNLPGGMVYQLSTGADGTARRFLYVSQSHERLTGVSAEAVLADPAVAYDLIHPDDRARMAEAEEESLRDRKPFDIQVRFRRADGEERWCRIVSAPREQPDGSVIWDGLQLDITDRIAAELALQELNQSLERRVEERTRERDRAWKNSRDLQVVVDEQGIFRAANEAWFSILGWRADEVVGRHHLDFVHPDDRPSSDDARKVASRTELAPYENRCKHKDGTYRWVSWVAAPENDLVYASGRHITAEKEAQAALVAAEEQLRQAQKMEAVGHLTGGIAHDFNNLLTVVTGNADMARRAIAAGDEAKAGRSITNALKGAERAALLTQRLLAFSRRQPLSPKPTDVGRLISGMSDLLARSLGETVQIETVSGAGLWQIDVDPHQLENAILNLAVNGRDAMPDGGKLTIEASNTRIGSTYAAANVEIAPGQYVVISVTDTGAGMPRATLDRAFDPFFTTKEVGKGTGLGLSQVYGFVKQSGGHVKIYSEVGHGSTIKLYLPRMAGTRQEEVHHAEEPTNGGRHSETILVVEDDDEVRFFSVETLRELGYRVLEAHDGPSALRLLQRQPEPIHLLFTDVVMPEMSGRDLADQARSHQPGLKILFTTGYARNAILHGGRLEPGVELLPKPFAYDALAAKVRSVLDASDIGRVLIVAADDEERRAICQPVASLGFSVELCATTREALGKVRSTGGMFDAILIECAPSAVRKFVREVRSVRNDLPILLMMDTGEEASAELLGRDECIRALRRPFSTVELRPALEELMVRCTGKHGDS
jgi:PAS domain S-box-containing protein